MSGWRLTWKRPPGPPALINGEPLGAAAGEALSREALGAIELAVGRRRMKVRDLFDIAPLEDGTPRLVVAGSPRFVRLGARMERGRIEIDGHGGEMLGAGLRGGEILVRGGAGDRAGGGMEGGWIRVEGDVGDLAGGPLPGEATGMRGGELLVLGKAGRELGLAMRRGLIAVAGEADGFVGRHLRAGTILVAHGGLELSGLGMRRGTIIGLEAAGVARVGFHEDGPVRHGWLRILLRRLDALAFPISGEARTFLLGERALRSWSGDSLALGRGELLTRPG